MIHYIKRLIEKLVKLFSKDRAEPRPKYGLLYGDDVEKLRKEFRKGCWTIKALAEHYQVSYYTIRLAISGRTWKNIPGALTSEEIKQIRRNWKEMKTADKRNIKRPRVCRNYRNRRKLSVDQVKEARALYVDRRATVMQIARNLNISSGTAFKMLVGDTYSDVDS